MEKLTIDAYHYAELSDKAKAKARDWYRDASAGDPSDLEYTLDDAATVAPLLGITLASRSVKLHGGGTRAEPDISYSVGFCQSDFAAFNGTWRAADFPKTKKGKPRVRPLLVHAPSDKELARICRELARIARAFPDLVGVVTHSDYYGLRVECESETLNEDAAPDAARVKSFNEAEKDVKEAMRDFARWIYQQLRDEVEYQSSDEAVTESIEANDYLFTADGARSVVL